MIESEKPLVSVIVPVYNISQYVERCFMSLVNQTYDRLEVLFIDDCSSDDSIGLLKNLIAREGLCQNYQIIHHDINKGLSAARNTGIDNAQGEYVFFLDGDDSLASNCISLLCEQAKKTNADFVIGDNSIIYPDKQSLIKSKIDDDFVHGNQSVLSLFVTGSWYNVAWNKLIRKSFLLENDLYFPVGYVHEDELWSMRLALCAETMGVIHDSTYHYYINDNSIMRQDPTPRMLQYIDVLSLMQKEIQNKKQENNLVVSRFFMLKQVVLIGQLQKLHALNAERIGKLCSLSYYNYYKMWCNKVISFKEMFAYLYLKLSAPLAYGYYKLISKFT